MNLLTSNGVLIRCSIKCLNENNYHWRRRVITQGVCFFRRVFFSLIHHSSRWVMLAKTYFRTHLLVSRCFSSVASKTLKVGDILKETRVFSTEDVKAYAEVSHDWNPLHFDPESARKAGFENRLVHGMLVSSMFPRIISAHFVSCLLLVCIHFIF